MEPNFQALRKEFPVLERKTYLNSGSYCALANDVKAAFEAYMEDRLLVGANWDVWITKNESVRALTATLLHASPDEIAVTASVSAGLNALASALDFSGRRAGRPRAACRRRLHSAGKFCQGDRRGDTTRGDHPCLLPERRQAGYSRHRAPRACQGCEGAARLLPSGRLHGYRCEGAGRGFCRGRDAQVLA